METARYGSGRSDRGEDLRARRRGRTLVIAGAAIVAAAAGTAAGSLAPPTGRAAAPSVPVREGLAEQSVVSPAPASPAPIGAVVTSPDRVLWARAEQMTPAGPPVVVVDSESPPVHGWPQAELQRLRVLAWDRYARHWTVVFDSASVEAETQALEFPSSVLDAPDDENALSPPSGPLDPFSQGVLGFSVTPLSDGASGHDLLVSARLLAGDSAPTVQAVLHDDGQFVEPAWIYASHQGSTVTVVGRPGHQEIELVAPWQTVDDPACCAARSFHALIAWRGPAPEGDWSGLGDGWQVVSDDRPFLGAWVEPVADFVSGGGPAASDTWLGNLGAVPQDSFVVLATEPGSPARSELRPGDVITGFVGLRPPAGDTFNEPLVDTFAEAHAGDWLTMSVLRDGRRFELRLRAASRAAPQAQDPVNAPDVAALGLLSEPDGGRGARVVAVTSGGPAAQAGITPGAVITAFGGLEVTSPAALRLAEAIDGSPDEADLRLVEPTGSLRRVEVSVTLVDEADVDLF